MEEYGIVSEDNPTYRQTANKQRFIQHFLTTGKRERKSQIHFLVVSAVLPQETLEGPSYIGKQLERLTIEVTSTYTIALAGHFVCWDLVKLFNFSWGVLWIPRK